MYRKLESECQCFKFIPYLCLEHNEKKGTSKVHLIIALVSFQLDSVKRKFDSFQKISLRSIETRLRETVHQMDSKLRQANILAKQEVEAAKTELSEKIEKIQENQKAISTKLDDVLELLKCPCDTSQGP